MFLESLTISSPGKVIRKIEFHKGLNLIVDDSENQITGNGVGKTTVLKLIDFCLGASPKEIYLDTETKRKEYKLVKDFLIQNKILIKLVLAADIDDKEASRIVIERNFLARKELIRKIDGEELTESEFESKLTSLIFPEHSAEKPTFRQIISHNIRYKDESINNTLKTLSKYTSDAEYETLYLFLFACEFKGGQSKQELLLKINQENLYKSRLEKKQSKTAYETLLGLVENDIEKLNKKKEGFNLNENFENDIDRLNSVRYKINQVGSMISQLNIRRELILESEEELNSGTSNIDLPQLKQIYGQATQKVAEIQKTFSELVEFHNKMVEEKVKFITKELPQIEKQLTENKRELHNLLQQEKQIAEVISKSESFEELEIIISELNEKHRLKGEYEAIIKQLDEVESNLKELYSQLNLLDAELFSENFEAVVKKQLSKFNNYFSDISTELYGEQYALKYDIKTNKRGQRLYVFNAFNTNLSSGKKQGEISCFDLAYTLFADSENIPCLHFLLNDKKELMHDNQLVKIGNFANRNNIQFVASILKDKLPAELNKDEYFILKLSQSSKLFKIESE